MEIRKTEERAEKAKEKQLAEKTEEVEKANKKEERKRELEIGIIEEKEISKSEQEKTGKKTLQQNSDIRKNVSFAENIAVEHECEHVPVIEVSGDDSSGNMIHVDPDIVTNETEDEDDEDIPLSQMVQLKVDDHMTDYKSS